MTIDRAASLLLWAFVGLGPGLAPRLVHAACPDTILGSVLPVAVSGSTVGSTNDFVGSCGGGGASAPDHTFQFTAPATNTYRIDTFGSAFDTVLYVRNGDCNGSEIACNDDYLPANVLQSRVDVSLTQGQTIVIIVDGFGGQSGSFELRIDLPSAPTSTPTRTPTPTPTPTFALQPTPTTTPSLFGVSGQIRYYSNQQPVGGATLYAQGTPATQTDGLGGYAASLGPGDWEVRPMKAGGTGSSVSSLDATFVLQAVVGLRLLTPEQALAGDTSGNGSLSSLDASRILQYVVGLIPALPVVQACGSDWAFIPVPASAPNQQVLPPVLSTAGCELASILYNPLDGEAADQDFQGIVFGDVNGNWQPAAGGGGGSAAEARVRTGPLRSRSSGRFDVPLLVESAGPYHAIDVVLRYDPRELRLVRVRRLRAASGALVEANDHPPGRVVVAVASPRPLRAGQGAPVALQFERRRFGAAPARFRPPTIEHQHVGVAE